MKIERLKIQLTFNIENRVVAIWGLPTRAYQAGDYIDWFVLPGAVKCAELLGMSRDDVIALEARDAPHKINRAGAIGEPCKRCSGTGKYDRNMGPSRTPPDVCFDCDGTGIRKR